jgi:hypothetical protein
MVAFQGELEAIRAEPLGAHVTIADPTIVIAKEDHA